MMSPKRYLEDLLHTYLDEHVERDFTESTNIGVLVGDVHLSNLKLKPKEVEIAPGVWVELVYGAIDLLHLQVPWMELRTGGIKGVVENCRFVFKIKSSEYSEDVLSHECMQYAEKMNKLDLEERKQVLLASQGSPLAESWMSRTMGSISSFFLAQLATGFSLRVNNVHCSLLLPNGTELEEDYVFEPSYLHVLASFESLEVGQLRPDSLGTANPSSFFFTKEISMRGLTVRVGHQGVVLSQSGSRAEFEALFEDSSNIFINPLHFSAEIKGERSEIKTSGDLGPESAVDKNVDELKSLKVISVDVKASNFEATPKVEQLQMFKAAADHILLSQSKTLYRSKFWELHPSFSANRLQPESLCVPPINSPKLTARELWRFAINAVLKLRREATCRAPARIKSVGEESEAKSTYGAIYRKVLLSKLPAASREFVSAAPSQLLTKWDRIMFDQIHRSSTLDELLLFRTAVHKSLSSSGVSRDDLSRVLIPASEFSELNFEDNKNLLDNPPEAAHRAGNEEEPLVGKITWGFKLRISRFAIAILSPLSESGQVNDESHTRAFTLLFYGLLIEKNSSFKNDSLVLTIGTIRAYGLETQEILICGGDPHVWLDESGEDGGNNSSKSTENNDVAVSIIYVTRLEDSASSGEIICLSKVFCATLHIHWHQSSMNFLRNLFDTISFSSLPSPDDHALVKKRRVATMRDTGRQNSLLSQRWNLRASLEGLQFSIPNFENGIHASATQTLAFSDNRFAILRVGRVSARGGDYTQLWLEDKTASTESGDHEEALRTTVRAIQTTVRASQDSFRSSSSSAPDLNSRAFGVHTFVYNVDCIEVLLVNELSAERDTDVKITRIPWSLSGALSLSKKPGDERFPDTRVDILCSRLDLILSVGSTITLIGSANQVVETLFSIDGQNGLLQRRYARKARNLTTKTYRPRIGSLANLSKFQLNVRFSTSNIALTSDRANVNHLIFASEVLRSFADKVVLRGELSQVMETKRRLLVVQLQKLGVKEKDVNQLIDELVASIRLEKTLDDAIQTALDKIAECTHYVTHLLYGPIIEVHIGKSKFVLNQLTYDHKLTVDVKKILVTGPSHVPLFQVQRDSNANEKDTAKPRKRFATKKNTSGGIKEEVDDNERAAIAFSFEYVETDAGFVFGQGDSQILENFGCVVRKRDGAMKIKADSHINLLFPTDSIPLLEKMVHASSRINSYLETLRVNRRKSTETFATRLERKASVAAIEPLDDQLGPRLKAATSIISLSSQPEKTEAKDVGTVDGTSSYLDLTLAVDLRSVDLVLSHEDNLLALLTLHKGQLKASIDFQFMSGSVSTTFGTVRLFDLSEVGSLHPTVIWPKTEHAQPSLAVVITLDPDKKASLLDIKIDVTLSGVRLCLLYRFLQELIAFTTLVETKYSELMAKLEKARLLALAASALESDKEALELDGVSEHEENASQIYDSDSSSSDDSDDTSFDSSSFESNSDAQARFSAKGPNAAGKNHASADGGDAASTSDPMQRGNPADDKNSTTGKYLLRWEAHLKDFVLFCPRNSSSGDLVALTVTNSTVCNSLVKNTWQAPTAAEVKEPFERKIPLFFNPATNSWTKKGDQHEGFSMSSFDFPMVSEPSTSVGTESMYADSSRYQSAYASFSSGATARFETPGSGEKSDGTDENPASPEDLQQEHGNVLPRICVALEHVSVYISLAGRLVNYEHSGEIAVDTEEIKDYFEVHDGHSVHFVKHKKRAAAAGASGTRGSLSSQLWRKVSLNPFNLLVVVDILPNDQSRILLSDTDDLSSLALNLTMAELYLLESVWFDNIFEAPLFFTRRARGHSTEELPFEAEEADRKSSFEKYETHSKHSNDTTASSDSTKPSSSATSRRTEVSYGTKEFFKLLRQQLIIGEFLLVRADIKIECFIDLDYFVKDLPSQRFLRSKDVLESINKELGEGALRGIYSSVKYNELCKVYSLPIAKVSIEGLVLHTRTLKDNSSEVAMGAGLVEIFDTRVPKQGVYDKVLRVGTLDHSPGEESRRLYGYADFDFGLKMNPSDVTKNGDIPLKLLVVNTESWTTTNVGVDGLELNLKNLEFVWLIVDYFACYFQFPEFGHPLVAAYQKIPENKVPYRGVDTRVFATRPQICIMENPLAPQSATLVLESEAGVFYRHVLDNKMSTRIEVKVLDVALVTHQRFSGHDRGLRGSAGSGTGIRTLIEFLDCDYSQHFIVALNHMDVQFCLLENSSAPPPIPSDNSKADEPAAADSTAEFPAAPTPSSFADFVDFEAERLTLKPVELFTPKCNNKFSEDLKKPFPERSCHLVTSYEEILFSVNLITEFINGKPDLASEEEEKASKKNKKRAAGKEKEKKNAAKEKQTDVAKAPPMSVFATVSIYGVRIIVVDNILGLHLPLLQIFLMELKLTFDTAETVASEFPSIVRRRSRSNAAELLTPRASAQEAAATESISEEADTECLKAYCKVHAWADYFNNLKKCWEPLMEKLIANALYEKSPSYGQGLTLRSESDIHVNISGAFFRTLNDLIRMFKSADVSQGTSKNANVDSRPVRTVSEEPLVSNRLERKLPPVQWCPVLQEGARFGFALQNSTGQPLRFVQQKDGGKNTISFIDDGERGALNFVATTTRIRNDVIVRDAFNVQQDRRFGHVSDESRASQSRTKKSLCLQISGYKAIPSVEADGLGVKYEDLIPIDIERRAKKEQLMKTMSGKVQNALKLVAEVVSMNRGRLLHLRSVFTVKNNTSHAIEIRASVEREKIGFKSPFPDVLHTVEPGENLYIPLALPQRSARESNGKALGTIKVRPATLKPVEDELGTEREDIQMGMDVDYSSDAVDLHDTVEANQWFRSTGDNDRTMGGSNNKVTDLSKQQLCCKINPKLKKKAGMFDMKSLAASLQSATSNIQTHSSKLPPFSYNIEIQRIGELEEAAQRNTAKLGVLQAALRGRLFHNREDRSDNKVFNPVHYNIIVHPPIVLESMLPWHAHFEILNADTSRLLWSSLIGPGKAKPIHTVTLEEPLRLRIHLKYCRTGNPVLFHTPLEEDAGRTFVGRINDIQKTVEGFLVETDGTGEDASVELADSLGQRLRLNIENVEGGGGERHIVVYCPYWIVNTSQYKLRLREEGSPKDQLPAGSVTATKDGTIKDGTRPVAYGSVKQWPEEMGRETIFPGKIPPLHQSHRENGQINNEDGLRNMLLDLPFEEIVKFAYMYNYPDSHSLGKRRVCIQIDDSDWSQGFSLDSVGTPIPLSIEHTEKGLLELGYKIKVAPGRLGKYTKIVRFMPRFVIMNRLEMDFKILQPTGFVGELLPVEVKAKHFVPYHLPAVFGERSLAVELEGPWTRTVFFDIEAIGTSTLRVMHKLDLGAVDHVNTRGLPQYEVLLKPEDDIGIWFETDWEEKNIVVKKFRQGSFAHEETDIQIGDVIIGYNFYAVDPLDPAYEKELDQFEAVTGRDFERVMTLMKDRESPMRLMIRTVEENIRLIRKDQQQAAELIGKSSARTESFPDEIALRLEVRQVEATTFIVVDAVDKDQSEYMLENYSVSHVIHYKQKGVTGNNWCTLVPGQSISYIWEDPFKPHKLLLKAGRNILSPQNMCQSDSDFVPGNIINQTQGVLEFLAGVPADEGTVVSLDEIGTKDREVSLPNGAEGKLYASVNIKNGSTKTLVISPDKSMQSQLMLELAYCGWFLKMQHEALSSLHSRCMIALKDKDRIQQQTGQEISAWYSPFFAQTLADLQRKQEGIKEELREVLQDKDKKELSDVVLSSYLHFESLLGQRIERKHQVMVEILEAKDLRQFVIGKLEDTYCSVQLRIGRRIFQGQAQPKYTNVCEQNMNPVWIGQRFIFDVPDFDDVSTKIKARDVKIRVNVLSKTLIRPIHRFLGQADIQFSCLKTGAEEEVKGFFLLRPESPSVTASKMVDVSGSIKLRLQWVHSEEGLLKYNLGAISNRLAELEDLGRVQQKLYQYADATYLARSDNILNLFQSEKGRGINIQALASGTLSLAGGIAGGTLSLAGGIAGAAFRMPGELVRGVIRKSVADSDSAKETTIENFVPSKPTLALPAPSKLATVLKNVPENEQDALVNIGGSKIKLAKKNNVRGRAFTKYTHNFPHDNESDAFEAPDATNHLHFRGRRSTHYEKLETLVGPMEESRGVRKNRLVSKVLDRRDEMVKDSQSFAKRFEDECRAAYMLVHTQKGKLLVTPLAAHNLPDKHKRKVCVRISYGELEKTTVSKPNSADLTWSSEELNAETFSAQSADNDDAAKDDKKSLQKSFDIETLNIKSSLLVQVMEEGLRKRKEIARLEIPIFNLLDCLCHTPSKVGGPVDRSSVKIDDNVYEMWFAMTPTDDLILGEGDPDVVQQTETEQQDYMAFSKGSDYKPCIQLRFKFTQREGDEGKEKAGERASSLYFRFQVPSLSVSIIDSINAREVMQCSIRGIECRHAVSKKFINSSLNVMWLQVDNQLPDPISAIILAPTPVKYPEPTIRINVRKDNELSREGLTSYDFIVVKVETLDLSLEQQTVVASWALIKNWFQEQASSSATGEPTEKGLRRDSTFHDLDQLGFATCNEFTQYDLYDLLPTLNLASKSDSAGKRNERKLYISFINITDVRINVSFIMNPKVQQSAQKVEKLQQASWSDDIDLLSSVTFFLSQVGVVALDLTSSISDAPITFAEFQREKIFETDTEVEKRLRQHYLYSALTQLYKIVGSLELVGNPVGLVTSLGIGVTDFFYEPYHALITNPTDIGKLGRGLAKGALSVVSNTTEGFIGTGTTVTRSLGRIGARFAMDPTYVIAREELQRQPRTPAEAIYRPFRDIGNGVYYGVVGLVKVPYNNYRRHRAWGIVPGIAKGLGGLLAKSVVGVVDAITHTGDAARELVRAVTRDQSAPVRRLRLRNQFGPDGRMLPYSYAAALGMHAAQALDRARLESMGNAINESVGFVTSMGRMLSLGGKNSASASGAPVGDVAGMSRSRSRRPSISGAPESPRGRSRSMSYTGFDHNDLSTDSYDDIKIPGVEVNGDNTNSKQVEFVIHTFIKKITRSTDKKVNSYQLVILTTLRVLVADYTKKKRGASQFVRRWEADIRHLRAPLLEPRPTGGGYLLTLSSTKVADTETLTALVKGPMIKLRKSATGKLATDATRESSDFVIESTVTEDDSSLFELYNCIAIAKTHTDLEIKHLQVTDIKNGVEIYGEDMECDEDGIFKIGPWEYSNAKFDEAESLLASKNAHLTRDLEATGWNLVRAHDGSTGKDKHTTWLDDERRVCINAHREALLALAQSAVVEPQTSSSLENLAAIGEGEGEGEGEAAVRKPSTNYLKGGLQAAQSMLVSSARSIERAVTAVSSVALSPSGVVPRGSGSSSFSKGSAEAAAPAASSASVALDVPVPSNSPRGIMVSGLSPKNSEKKKGISFDFDIKDRAGAVRSGSAGAAPGGGSTSPFDTTSAAQARPASPIAGSPSSSSPAGNSLAKLFSPFPASPAAAQAPSASASVTTGAPTLPAVPEAPSPGGDSDAFNELYSEMASQAGTMASQDSEAMSALHGRLDRLERLLLEALCKK